MAIQRETTSVKVWKEELLRVKRFIIGKEDTLTSYISELIKKDMDRKEAKSSKK